MNHTKVIVTLRKTSQIVILDKNHHKKLLYVNSTTQNRNQNYSKQELQPKGYTKKLIKKLSLK